MEYLDAYNKDEILVQLLEGEWQLLFPKNIFIALSDWFERSKDAKQLAVRFVCQSPKDSK